MRRFAAKMIATVVFTSMFITAQPEAMAAELTPTVASVSAVSGWDLQPTITFISGTHLAPVTKVLIGTVAANIQNTSDTSIQVEVPARSVGRFPVIVVLADGTQFSNPAVTFTVKSINAEVLRLTNVARATTRKCGSKTFKKTGPLKASSKLNTSALKHSTEMATRNYFSHYGKNGSNPGQRMRAAGAKTPRWGENIAAAFFSPESVVKAWIKSKGHCEILMASRYHYLGVGYAANSKSKYGTYWTQDFTS